MTIVLPIIKLDMHHYVIQYPQKPDISLKPDKQLSAKTYCRTAKKPKLINGLSNFEIANFIIKTHFCLNLSNSKPSINLDVHRHNFF